MNLPEALESMGLSLPLERNALNERFSALQRTFSEKAAKADSRALKKIYQERLKEVARAYKLLSLTLDNLQTKPQNPQNSHQGLNPSHGEPTVVAQKPRNKRILIVSLLLILALGSFAMFYFLNQRVEKQPKAPTTTPNVSPAVITFPEEHSTLQFSGSVGKIAVKARFDFLEVENELPIPTQKFRGNYRYTSMNLPIPVEGSLNAQGLIQFTAQTDGGVEYFTGQWSVKKTIDVSGKWEKTGKKTRTFKLHQ
jgi:hypothetical protein